MPPVLRIYPFGSAEFSCGRRGGLSQDSLGDFVVVFEASRDTPLCVSNGRTVAVAILCGGCCLLAALRVVHTSLSTHLVLFNKNGGWQRYKGLCFPAELTFVSVCSCSGHQASTCELGRSRPISTQGLSKADLSRHHQSERRV